MAAELQDVITRLVLAYQHKTSPYRLQTGQPPSSALKGGAIAGDLCGREGRRGRQGSLRDLGNHFRAWLRLPILRLSTLCRAAEQLSVAVPKWSGSAPYGHHPFGRRVLAKQNEEWTDCRRPLGIEVVDCCRQRLDLNIKVGDQHQKLPAIIVSPQRYLGRQKRDYDHSAL